MYISNNKTRKVVCVMMTTHHRNLAQSAIFSSLQDILPENPARFIDAFVESLSLQTLGFLFKPLKERSPEL
jgi:hypothetical protein